MKKTVPNAFTLVELLVVITIMAIIGTFTVANFGSFGKDKELQNAALDVQSLLRTAQTNASANVKCPNDIPSKKWLVNFISSQRIDLDCADSTGGVSSVKSLSLGNDIQLGAIENTAPPVPPPACLNFSNQTSQTCTTYYGIPANQNLTGNKYIKCPEIPSKIDCGGSCGSGVVTVPNIYNDSVATSVAANNVQVAESACSVYGTPTVTLTLSGGSSVGGTCSLPVKFNFAPLSGAFSSDCGNSSIMEIGVQNAKGSVKLVKVTAGNISIAEGVAVSPLPTASSAPTPSPTPSPSPSPSPSSSPGGGTCPGFKYNGAPVSSQTCQARVASPGTYYVRCSQVQNSQNSGVLDCYSGGCQKQLDYYLDAELTNHSGIWNWAGGQDCINGYTVNLTVIP